MIGTAALAAPLAAPPPAAHARPLSEGTFVDRPTVDEATEVFDGINAYRVQQGRAPLRFMPALHELAEDWAETQGENDTFQHRSGFLGLYPPRPAGGGEIIAWRTDSNPSGLVAQWINSPAHRDHLLGNYTHMGPGVVFATGYQGRTGTAMLGVTNFARYTSTSAAPSFASVEGWRVASGEAVHDVIGQVTSVSASADGAIVVRGWAYDGSDARATVNVSFWVKGQPAVVAAANRPSPELAAEQVVGNHGFEVRMQAPQGAVAEVCGQANNVTGPGDRIWFPCISRDIPAPLEFVRIPARDTQQASVDLSVQHSEPALVQEVYLAPSHVYFESLLAAPAAARQDRALLLVDPAGPSSALLSELRRLAPATVTAVGLPDVLPESTLRAVRTALPQANVARVQGSDVPEISTNFARQEFPGARSAYLTAISAVSDEISASSAAARAGVPLILTDRVGDLPQAVTAYFAEARPEAVRVVGGSPWLSGTHERQVEAATPVTDGVAVRGADRFQTNVAALASSGGGPAEAVYLASALSFGHAAVSSAIATGTGPVALTSVECVPPDTHDFVADTVRPSTIVAMGREWTVSQYAADFGRCAS
ncbi:CAP domain-containing protein [Agrococcus sp. KRD186]|jgi:uncharacterized protein YkwD|uniref:CAP domain-containing protein n=1 Tax=Agrococcus sp. KRD186 TaxID=2729730 RepID=UPI0019D3002B|nr:CAP domain-containing protein [Agrococcus sp. KRD186]